VGELKVVHFYRLDLTDDERQDYMEYFGTGPVEFKRALPLCSDEPSKSEQFFRMVLT
jgi:hypothetical protein